MNNIGEKISWEEIVKKSRDLNVPELFKILKSNISIFFSWGPSNFIVDDKKNPRMLRFNVNGMKHKGHVYIFLNFLDLFDVYLTTNQGKIKKIGKDLYFDELRDWIDENIEKQENYKY